MNKTEQEEHDALTHAVCRDDLDHIASADPTLVNIVDRANKTALFYALYRSGATTDDDPSTVQALLALGADPNQTVERRDGSQRSPLRQAAIRSLSTVAKTLVDAGADLDGIMHVAAEGGLSWLVERCLESTPVDESSGGSTALHDACYFGSIEIVDLLLGHGADPLARVRAGDWQGYDTLQFAIVGNSPDVVRRMLDLGVESTLDHLRFALDPERTWAPPREEIEDVLLDMLGASITPWAPAAPIREIVQLLQEDLDDDDACRAVAREAAKARLSRTLYEAPHGPDALNRVAFWVEHFGMPEQCDVLFAAASVGSAELVQFLIDQGADPNSYDRTSGTPLHRAAEAGNADAVRALLAGGARPNLSTYPEGQHQAATALSIAVRGDDLTVARVLLEGGADPMMFELDGELIARSLGDDPEQWQDVEQHFEGFDPWFDYPMLAAASDEMRALLLQFGGHYAFDVDPYDVEMYFEELDDPLWWPLLEQWLDHVELTPTLLANAAHAGWRAGVERIIAGGVRLTWDDAIEFGLEPTAFDLLRELGAPLPAPQTLRQRIIAGDVAGIEADELEDDPQLLENAIYARSDAVAAALIRKGVKAAPHGRDMPTLAARFGLIETVGAFLDAGRPIDGSGDEGTLLRNAASWGQLELVRELLRRGADPTLSSVPAGDADVMRLLLDAGAHAAPDRILEAVAEGRVPAGALDVLEEYIDLDYDTAQCRVALYKAAKGGHADALRAICRFCDPNLASAGTLASLSAPPLYVAAQDRHHDALRALLDCGADPRRTAADNKTAYLVADLAGRRILRKHASR